MWHLSEYIILNTSIFYALYSFIVKNIKYHTKLFPKGVTLFDIFHGKLSTAYEQYLQNIPALFMQKKNCMYG